jgi:EAL domain-containing protein (putative c-di-GMP-specific phosphodiesterase class I)
MKNTILETILDPRALSVCFQPIFRLERGEKRVDSVEALVRGPRGTQFARADVLFDYVRRKRAEAAVDQSCFTAICDAALDLPVDLRVNINVHASTLGQKFGFVDFFRHQAKKRSLPLERFTLEIVEHAPTCNIPELANSISELHASGVRIALDDVGLGQSNYRMMLDCDPDYFKLDAYFVRGLAEDPKRRAVIQSLVALAQALKSSVVAEGPSTSEDLALLAALGVDLVQANLLCPAMPVEELLETGFLVEPQGAAAPTVTAKPNQVVHDFEYRRMQMHMVAGPTFYT